MLQPCPPTQIYERSKQTGRDVDGPRVERVCYIVSSDRRLGGEVERARGAPINHARNRVGDIISMNERNT